MLATRNLILPTILLLAPLAALRAAEASASVDTAAHSPAAKPNVLFILVDDLGWSDTSCYGRKEWRTPSIDRLAESGCRFTSAYAMPLCSPTRSSLLSGKHCARIGITDWIYRQGGFPRATIHKDGVPSGITDRYPGFPPPNDSRIETPPMTQEGLLSEEVTFGEAFAEAGYVTCHVGKWHVGNVPPEKQGFQHVAETEKGHVDEKTERYTEAPKVEAAIRFLKDNRNNPFLLYLCFTSVHVPIMATPEKVAKHADAPNPTYAAMVDHLDEYIGQVMATMKELDLLRNTIVIFYSDNGGVGRCNFESNVITRNFPLRGNKGTLYEGGLRVPLIVSYPGHIQAGSVSDAIVGSADFYPTMLELCGIPLRPEQHRDGVSFAGVFRGDKGKRQMLQWHYPHFSRHTMGFPSGAIRRDDWKLIEWFGQTAENGKNRIELFNLAEDPGEQNDVADHFPKLRDSLLGELVKWRAETGAVMPTLRDLSTHSTNPIPPDDP